jgi:hypothetical protein
MASVNLDAILKSLYDEMVGELYLENGYFYNHVKKTTNFKGDDNKVSFDLGEGGGGGAFVLSTSIANQGSDNLARMTITRKKDYATFQINQETIDAATSPGALKDGLKLTTRNAMRRIERSMGIQMARNGGGARGRIASTSTVNTTTITLQNPAEAANFTEKMVVNVASTDGTSGAIEVGAVTLDGVDRDAGTLRGTAIWNVAIPTVAPSMWVFRNGDFAAANQAMKGVAAWVPTSAPTLGDSFNGLDRSTNPTMLAGVRYSAGAGGRIENTLVQLSARLAVTGSKCDVCIMNPLDVADFINELGAKATYQKIGYKGGKADAAFEGVNINTAMGTIPVIGDLNFPMGLAYMLQMDTWEFRTLLKAPRFLTAGDDDRILRRNPDRSDSYVGDIGYYGDLICHEPGHNGVGTL